MALHWEVLSSVCSHCPGPLCCNTGKRKDAACPENGQPVISSSLPWPPPQLRPCRGLQGGPQHWTCLGISCYHSPLDRGNHSSLTAILRPSNCPSNPQGLPSPCLKDEAQTLKRTHRDLNYVDPHTLSLLSLACHPYPTLLPLPIPARSSLAR